MLTQVSPVAHCASVVHGSVQRKMASPKHWVVPLGKPAHPHSLVHTDAQLTHVPLAQIGVAVRPHVPQERIPPQPSATLAPQALRLSQVPAVHVVWQQAVPLPHPELLIEPFGILVLQKIALERLVELAKVASVKSALTRQAPLRLARVKLTPVRSASRRLARERLQRVQSSD